MFDTIQNEYECLLNVFHCDSLGRTRNTNAVFKLFYTWAKFVVHVFSPIEFHQSFYVAQNLLSLILKPKTLSNPSIQSLKHTLCSCANDIFSRVRKAFAVTVDVKFLWSGRRQTRAI